MPKELDQIKKHLQSALDLSQAWQTKVQTEEGDTDLTRKLAFYLTPNLNHWLHGQQAGNMKDLEELFKKRDEKATDQTKKNP